MVIQTTILKAKSVSVNKSLSQEKNRELIQKKAYELYEKRGYVHGNDWGDWFKAERIVKSGKYQ